MLITNIQRFSLDDGPGIRTTVFMAGCNLRCLWCHNPEAIYRNLLGYNPEKCIGCQKCSLVCKQNAHIFTKQKHIIDRDKCIKCMECVKLCEYDALVSNTKEMSIEEIYHEIKKDINYYNKSGGGVTFSGGEPMLQDAQLLEILKICKENKIHTAMETAGNYSFEKLNFLLNLIDLIIIDCKNYLENKHIKNTGHSNKEILENITRLSSMNKRMWIRIPVIEKVNIDLQEIERIGKFLSGRNVEKVELLPYHKFGISKYKTYGIKYSLNDVKEPSFSFMQQCRDILEQCGINVI